MQDLRTVSPHPPLSPQESIQVPEQEPRERNVNICWLPPLQHTDFLIGKLRKDGGERRTKKVGQVLKKEKIHYFKFYRIFLIKKVIDTH